MRGPGYVDRIELERMILLLIMYCASVMIKYMKTCLTSQRMYRYDLDEEWYPSTAK